MAAQNEVCLWVSGALSTLIAADWTEIWESPKVIEFIRRSTRMTDSNNRMKRAKCEVHL